jgi:hypothetical protein
MTLARGLHEEEMNYEMISICGHVKGVISTLKKACSQKKKKKNTDKQKRKTDRRKLSNN